ncbi:MAG: 3-isopropylmalate dehydratase large subunit [Deltaproteobacteria bacterium]|nr:3-isopropylmalate dehydratase large subunit [Deltaproteobacteria bacterium]
MKKTLFEKIWASHVVLQAPGAPAVLSIDLHLVHEVTSPQAFSGLRARGLKVRRPDRTVATMDHSTPTVKVSLPMLEPQARAQLEMLARNCEENGIRLHAYGSETTGIVHVVGPERGLTLPGSTIVCGDSHTSTHGAFGALAFGIGTSEVEHVLATQALLQHKPKTFAVNVEGARRAGVTAKDIILAVCGELGVGGGTGYVLEYRGSAIRALDMAGRMTVCNMSIEAGARAGMIAPDDTTYEFLARTPEAPKGAAWEAAVAKWRQLPTDEGATFDRSVTLDASRLAPMITFGTNPGQAIAIDQPVPGGAANEKALAYMDLEAGKPLLGRKVDVVFVGSWTNPRMEDLRATARVLEGRKVDPSVRMLVVPGSKQVQRDAEAEGLDRVFRAAGAEWREPGCSMCIAMNGDEVPAGKVAVSTSNRNFEGRQGKGSRTLLASPLTAAASAVTGVVTDPRTLLGA